MKPGVFTRVVAGMSVATPVTIIVAGSALALGASYQVAGLVGAAAGAISGLIVQRIVVADEQDGEQS